MRQDTVNEHLGPRKRCVAQKNLGGILMTVISLVPDTAFKLGVIPDIRYITPSSVAYLNCELPLNSNTP